MSQVHIAAAEEADVAIRALMVAFASDPCTRYGLSRPADFLEAFPDFAWAMGGAAFASGTAWLAGDGRATALWLPPGVSSDSERIVEVMIPRAPPERIPTMAKVGEAMGAFHPQEPHWYLPLIGVDPAAQGQGLGSALMAAGLARCDAEGLPAYLESSNPRNVPLYQRYGFEVMGEIAPDDFPVMHPMYRAARR